MRKLGAVLSLVSGLTLASATPALANGFASYRMCGGNTFQTCAAVQVSVVGNHVTMHVWNLSQNMAGTYGQAAGTRGSSILDGISFFNIPAGVHVNTASLTVNGSSNTGGWSLKNFGNVAFALDTRNANHLPTGGISSACGLLPGSAPTTLSSPCTNGLGGSNGWVTFDFQVTGTWNPHTSDISLRSYDAATGETSEYWTGNTPFGNPATNVTVTPEPVTMTLLATGLTGIGGAGIFRRRRKPSDQV
jgi:hypothetical protein